MKPGHCCALVEGFSIHAGVCVPARDRVRLGNLLRYAARPPVSKERLSLLPDGRLLYRLKRRWSDGTTQVIYEPMELMERLQRLCLRRDSMSHGITACWLRRRPSGHGLFPKKNPPSRRPTRAVGRDWNLSKRTLPKPMGSGAGSREIIPGLN